MKIKALAYFFDGNIFAAPIDTGEVIEVSQREYEMALQSGGEFEVLPNSAEVSPIENFRAPGTSASDFKLNLTDNGKPQATRKAEEKRMRGQ